MSDPQSPFALFRPLLPGPLRDLDAWPHPTLFALQDVLEGLLALVFALVDVSRSALEAQSEATLDVEVLTSVGRSLALMQEFLRIAQHLEATRRRTPPDA
jgi:hypothetical protein